MFLRLNCLTVFGFVETYDDKFCDSSSDLNIDIPSYEQLLIAFHELQDDMTSLCIKNIELKMQIKVGQMRSNL